MKRVTPEPAVDARSSAAATARAVAGLVLFPLAGVGLLAHLVTPLGFVALASLAAAIFFASLRRLDLRSTGS
ncbi:MAG TPA: hypothetical protein VM580_03215 [Labilithrix sp.]|nr:hypothetical protein [Labilithrix sp.]